MVRALTLAAAALSAWTAARAQVPPRVEVQRLPGKPLAKTQPGMVGVGDCLNSIMPHRQLKKAGRVSVTLFGPWERSAEHLAKQAAAELGANCLLPFSNYGPEDGHYPLVRQYRAYFLTTVVDTVWGSFRVPASPRSFAQTGPARPLPSLAFAPATGAASASTGTAAAPAEQKHGPVWFEHALLDSHEIELETARMTRHDWDVVKADLERYFSAEQMARLGAARAAGHAVSIDLRARTVRPLAAEPRK